MVLTALLRESDKDFLVELGERFPDMTDVQVCLAYDEYLVKRMIPTHPDSLRGKAVIAEYEKGVPNGTLSR
jgi:hypothetical protein